MMLSFTEAMSILKTMEHFLLAEIVPDVEKAAPAVTAAAALTGNPVLAEAASVTQKVATALPQITSEFLQVTEPSIK